MMAQKLVVIGAGMASGRVLEHLTEAAPDAFDITLFNAKPRGNYNRIMFGPVLAGDKSYDRIVTHDDAWYEAHDITCRFGAPVTRIDRAAKRVIAGGQATPYDKLVIATGLAPFIIPVAGRDLSGVVSFRNLDDVERMQAAAAPARRSWARRAPRRYCWRTAPSIPPICW
ncbi:hypothetical protein GCM10008024_34280 [Allgaiera indica]|uniref:Nitrite reductase (NADH) large subunit n=1 Tax=Allgaiera indica TaxID=765699 RepID=A0AAN4UUE7_9RHOB|nr:hypothetical protein GCM10008024_34280 [Allgaiera indica]SDX60863.1 nitrite reductase (NADH) large subunit [Allgaiera indica]